MSSLSDSIARLQDETQSLAAALAAATALRSSGFTLNDSRGSAPLDASAERQVDASAAETLRAVERCAAALELLAGSLDGGRMRVVLDESQSPTARYS